MHHKLEGGEGIYVVFVCLLTQKRLKFPPFFIAFDIHPLVGLLLLVSLREHGGKEWKLTSAQGDLQGNSS